MIVDAHHHLWRYDPAEFGWIGDDLRVLRRDFLPGDLARQLDSSGVVAAVAVQARQMEEETRWLLHLAAEEPRIAGVVGWAPLIQPDIEHWLERHVADRKLVGLRHVVQAEPDEFLARQDFNRGVAALRRHGLVYDLLVLERQLPATIEFVDRHPDQPFVLDHLGKPRNDTGELEPWRTNLRELARRENVSCKLSGGITEADLDWTPAKLRPYLDAALEAFGPRRLMFGSNWPVCEAAGGGYGAWLDAVRAWAEPLSADERGRLLAGTAVEVYGLEIAP
jgi:L-fuconolactonase